ncbi:unnamed protein product [Lactuca saligna]|uniref:Uncharacterized protein n=1 Tax=Lactuca saligna TaxID=75948 RepID=A0AA35UWQ8_LACSI|nr:unnamed protein product [Lactuca saligna]
MVVSESREVAGVGRKMAGKWRDGGGGAQNRSNGSDQILGGVCRARKMVKNGNGQRKSTTHVDAAMRTCGPREYAWNNLFAFITHGRLRGYARFVLITNANGLGTTRDPYEILCNPPEFDVVRGQFGDHTRTICLLTRTYP